MTQTTRQSVITSCLIWLVLSPAMSVGQETKINLTVDGAIALVPTRDANSRITALTVLLPKLDDEKLALLSEDLKNAHLASGDPLQRHFAFLRIRAADFCEGTPNNCPRQYDRFKSQSLEIPLAKVVIELKGMPVTGQMSIDESSSRILRMAEVPGRTAAARRICGSCITDPTSQGNRLNAALTLIGGQLQALDPIMEQGTKLAQVGWTFYPDTDVATQPVLKPGYDDGIAQRAIWKGTISGDRLIVKLTKFTGSVSEFTLTPESGEVSLELMNVPYESTVDVDKNLISHFVVYYPLADYQEDFYPFPQMYGAETGGHPYCTVTLFER